VTADTLGGEEADGSMAQVIWTEPALADLEAIADDIALDNPEAARRLVQRRVSSGNGNLRTLRVWLHSFKPANRSLPWLPKWTEVTFRNPSVRVPNIISGQINVFPA
jgi:hypothetical protein